MNRVAVREPSSYDDINRALARIDQGRERQDKLGFDPQSRPFGWRMAPVKSGTRIALSFDLSRLYLFGPHGPRIEG